MKQRLREFIKFLFLPAVQKKFRRISTGHYRLHRGTAVSNEPSSLCSIAPKAFFEFNKKWSEADPFSSLLVLREKASLLVHGSFQIYSGAGLYVNAGAELSLGSGYINHNLSLSCFQKIEIGHGVAISENVSIRDSDNHEIKESSVNKTQPVKIGNHVWIGMNVVILKGVVIGDGAVIAAGAVVNKSIPSNCLAGGVPAKILKENIKWD